MLEVVRPSPQPSGQQDEDPNETESSTGTGEDEQHVEDMLSEEEPQLEEESAIQIPPHSDGSLLPKPQGHNHNQIMGKLDDLAAQLQRLGETSLPDGLRPINNYSAPPQFNRGTDSSNVQAPGRSYGSNPNTSAPAKLKQEILSGEFFELGKLLPIKAR